MTVRDRSLKKSDYKGRPFDATDYCCPCRSCLNNHDCGRNQKVYKDGLWVENEWVPRMECATRYNQGCPRPLPEPVHDFGKARRYCRRCGALNIELANRRLATARKQWERLAAPAPGEATK